MSLKKLSILTKLLIFLLPIVFLVFLILFSVLYTKTTSIEQSTYKKEQSSLSREIQNDLKIKLNTLKNIVIAVSENSIVVDNMYNEEREPIFNEIFKLREALKKNKSLKNPLIQIVDTMSASYVKSWNKNAYGADVSSRKSIQYVQKTKKIFVAPEITRGGIMMVATSPLIYTDDDDKEYVGNVDLILRMSSLIYKTNNTKDTKKLLILVNKDRLDEAKYIKNPIFINNYYVDNGKNKPNKKFIDLVSSINFKLLNKNGYIIDDKYFYTYSTIKNHSGDKIGIFLIAKPINEVNSMSNKASEALISLIVIFLIASLIILFILIFIIKILILSPLSNLVEISKDISSGRGDLTKCLAEKSDDEIGRTSHFFNRFIEKVRDMVLNVIVSGHKTYENVESVTDNLVQINNRMNKEREFL